MAGGDLTLIKRPVGGGGGGSVDYLEEEVKRVALMPGSRQSCQAAGVGDGSGGGCPTETRRANM